jgi:hypothetical protein
MTRGDADEDAEYDATLQQLVLIQELESNAYWRRPPAKAG